MSELLDRIEAYYDAVPRAAARAEDIGPLTLFVNRGASWPYYGRPRLGGVRVTAADVAAVRARQRRLGVPEAFEWIAEVTPSMRAAAEEAGLAVHDHPLLALDHEVWASAGRAGAGAARIRLIGADAPDLAVLRAVAHVGFAWPGTQVGPAGPEELAEATECQDPATVDVVRERLRLGLTVMAAAYDATTGRVPLSVGSHQPVGDATEVVGVATLPSARRRGLGAAVTRALVADAIGRGCTLIFLSAGDDAVARVYERVGFARVGTALIAEPR